MLFAISTYIAGTASAVLTSVVDFANFMRIYNAVSGFQLISLVDKDTIHDIR